MASWANKQWRRLTHREPGSTEEPQDRVEEAEARVGEPQEQVDIDALIKALDDPDYSEARKAARDLGKMGDVKAVEALVRAVEGTDLDVRREAAEALGTIGSAEGVHPLIAALTDTRTHPERHAPLQISASNADARIEAAWALGEIGDTEAVDALNSVKHLQLQGLYRGCTLAQAAAEALAKLGVSADEVAPPPDTRLIEALLSPLSSERERAIDAVEEEGEARSDDLDRAYEASRKMKEAIKHHGPTQRQLVEQAIELVPTFSAALGLLSNICQYEDGSTAEALEWATKAVAADTSDWLAWIQLGRLCAHSNRDAVEATRAFSESVYLSPEVEGGLLSEPYSYLLPVYERLSMWEQATDARARVTEGGTNLSESHEREWLALVAAAPEVALRDATDVQRDERSRSAARPPDLDRSTASGEKRKLERISLEEAKRRRRDDGDLSYVDLSDMDLRSLSLAGVNLTGSSLSGANLEGMGLDQAILVDADLSHANLRGVFLQTADLTGANLEGADTTGAYL